MKQLALLFPLLWLVACHTPQTLVSPAEGEQEPEILFVFVEIKKEEEQPRLRLKKLVRNKGVLKETYSDTPVMPGQLLCSFLDQEGNVFAKRPIDDPLNAVYEYVEETGELKTVQVEKEEDVFFVRVQDDPAIASLKVEKLLAEGQLVVLAAFSLQETN